MDREDALRAAVLLLAAALAGACLLASCALDARARCVTLRNEIRWASWDALALDGRWTR